MEQFNIPLPDLLSQFNKDTFFPCQDDYDYWASRSKRVFYIDYEIDPDYYRLIELSKAIIQLNFEEKDIPENELKPIYIMIHSYGGDLEQSFYFCDLIMSSRIPIYTVAMGVAMSAGFLLFISGHKKFAFPHSQLLIHSGRASLDGTAEQIEEAQKNYKRQQESMKKYILENTEIPEKVFQKNAKKDWYLTCDELVEYKVVDEIITDFTTIFK